MIKHRINKNVPIELIKGIEYDLKGKVNVKTFEELVKYSYQVAGTVGYMFCKIIGVKEKKLILFFLANFAAFIIFFDSPLTLKKIIKSLLLALYSKYFCIQFS